MRRLLVLSVLLTGCSPAFNFNFDIDGTAQIDGHAAAEGDVYVSVSPIPSSVPSPQPSPLVKPIVSVAYTAGPQWNDYVKTADTATACAGTETGYRDCFHSGVVRKAQTEELSCSGLTLVDTLNVFTWTCSVENSKAVFYSSLKSKKGLSHLINAGTWRTNSVTLNRGSEMISSDSATWWTNSITALPSNSSTSSVVVSLTSAGTIYYTDSAILSSGYNIGADKVSIVTLGSGSITYNGRSGTNTGIDGMPTWDYRTVLAAGSRKFIWVEGTYALDGTSGGFLTILISGSKFAMLNNVTSIKGDATIYLYQTDASTLQSVTATQAGGSSIMLDSSDNNLVNDTFSYNNTAHYAIQLGGAGGNDIYNTRVYNNFGAVRVSGSPTENHVVGLVSANTTAGVYFVTNSNIPVLLSQATFSNVSSTVLNINASNRGTVHNVVVTNGATATALTNALDYTFSQTSLTHSNTGITSSTATGLKLTGNMLIGNNTTNCQVQAGSTGYTNSCALAGSSDALIGTANLTNSFVGKITTFTDAWFETLGLNGSAFANSDHRGICTTSCQAWDWSLTSTDTALLNRSGNGSTANASCAAVISDNLTGSLGNSYLKNAVELLESTGNRNGLCESGDTCLYTPNFGAYQGHGELTSCTFTAGSGNITGVTVKSYLQNGR